MKISRYNILTTVVVIAIAVSIPFLISGTTTTSQQQTNTPYNIFSPEVPTKINFAGKEIDVRRYDLRERLDRELTAFTYMHSTTLLMIKRANRYFPIVEPILKENGVPDDFKYLRLSKVIWIHGHVLHAVLPDCGNLWILPEKSLGWR